MNSHIDWLSTAHTISQRLRRIKQVPPELIPLGTFSDISSPHVNYSWSNAFLILGIVLGYVSI